MSDSKKTEMKAEESSSKDQQKEFGLLEEDDEFEEFPAEEWDEAKDEEEEDKVNFWEDNWDDDQVEDLEAPN